jgi:pimeloyl-ACP methyl ester carboxylesterase
VQAWRYSSTTSAAWGKSAGTWAAATVDDLAHDAAAALAALQARPRVTAEQLTEAAQAGRSYRQAQQILTARQHEPWYPSLSADGFTLDSDAWAQLTAWADYDPYDDLVRLETPTLAIFGQHDPLTPVRASIARYEQTAARTARIQQIRVFPGAGHRLQVITTGLAPGYLTLLSTWCLDHR